jgi:hypothetical protein
MVEWRSDSIRQHFHGVGRSLCPGVMDVGPAPMLQSRSFCTIIRTEYKKVTGYPLSNPILYFSIYQGRNQAVYPTISPFACLNMSASRFLCSRCLALLFASACLAIVSSSMFRIIASSSGVASMGSSPVSLDSWEKISDSEMCFMLMETARSCGASLGGVDAVEVVAVEGVVALVEGEA